MPIQGTGPHDRTCYSDTAFPILIREPSASLSVFLRGVNHPFSIGLPLQGRPFLPTFLFFLCYSHCVLYCSGFCRLVQLNS